MTAAITQQSDGRESGEVMQTGRCYVSVLLFDKLVFESPHKKNVKGTYGAVKCAGFRLKGKGV